MSFQSPEYKMVVQKPNERPLVLNNVRRKKLTIGSDVACTYTLEHSAFDRKFNLVRRRSGRDLAVIPPGVKGELGLKDSERRLTFEELRAFGVCESVEGGLGVPLSPGSFVIYRVGDVTLAFEPTAGMQVHHKDNLPWALRYGPPSINDRIFMGLMALSFLLTFFLAWEIRHIPVSPKAPEELLQERYAKLILETPMRLEDLESPEILEPKEKKEEEPKKEEKSDAPVEKPKERKKRDVRSSGLLAQLETSGDVGKVLESKELSKAIEGVGVLTAKRDGSQRSRGPAFAYRDASGLDELAAGIVAKSGSGTVEGAGRKGSTAVGNPFELQGSGSRHSLRSYQEIDKIIRQHLEGIRLLYERYLRTEPNLQGRVSLRFTIDAAGKVTDCAVVTSNLASREFELELVKRVKLWRFPAIEASAGSVSVLYPFTFLPKRN